VDYFFELSERIPEDYSLRQRLGIYLNYHNFIRIKHNKYSTQLWDSLLPKQTNIDETIQLKNVSFHSNNKIKIEADFYGFAWFILPQFASLKKYI
jgi:hypothetical protein